MKGARRKLMRGSVDQRKFNAQKEHKMKQERMRVCGSWERPSYCTDQTKRGQGHVEEAEVDC